MSSDETPNVPADRDRREAVREKAQQVKARQSRLRAVRISSLVIGALAVVAVIVVGVGIAISSNASKPLLQPAAAPDNGFAVVRASAPAPSPSSARPVQIRVYVDYLSTGARDFQAANGAQLTKWVDQGAATLTYYPVAMLTSKSNGTKYSLRAASASACVATHDATHFFAYNDLLLARQPAADSDGFTDAQLADLAVQAGAVDSAVRDCIVKEDFAAWAKNATDAALTGLPGVSGQSLTAVPTVLVNGTAYAGAFDDPKEFAQFVLTLASDAYYTTASPTPPAATPTATPSATPAP